MMKSGTIDMEFRGEIEPGDLDELHVFTERDETSEVSLTSQLSGESILKVAVSIAMFGPKFLGVFRTIVRADNIKVIKVELKSVKVTIENINPKHFEAVCEFIEKIKQ